jgi:hypothetical protein
MSDGTVAIHKLGCQHRAGSRPGGPFRQDQVEFGKTDWTSAHAFAYDYWNNGILDEYEDEHGKGSFDVFVEMDFAPCTKTLPRNDKENEVSETKKAPRGKAAGGDNKVLGSAPGEVPAPTAHLANKGHALEGGLCRCGCGGKVGKGSTFKQGHDARWVSKLVARVTSGQVTKAEALKEAKAVSEALHGKLGKALDLAAIKAEKAKAAAAAKEQATKDKLAADAATASAKEAEKE